MVLVSAASAIDVLSLVGLCRIGWSGLVPLPFSIVSAHFVVAIFTVFGVSTGLVDCTDVAMLVIRLGL